MSDAELDPAEYLPQITRVCQIILGAMQTGVLVFLTLVVFVIKDVGPAPAGAAGLPVITYVAGAVGLAGLVLSFLVPAALVASGRRKIAEGTWTPPRGRGPSRMAELAGSSVTGKFAILYQTQLIIATALCEGAAFFACIAYMIEREPMAILLALVLLTVMASRFPTTDRVAAWIDRQLESLAMKQQGLD